MWCDNGIVWMTIMTTMLMIMTLMTTTMMMMTMMHLQAEYEADESAVDTLN